MMMPAAYTSVRKRLQTDGAFHVRTFYGAATVVSESLILGASLALVFSAEAFSLLYWLGQVLLGLSMFRMFVIVHECGHNTLFRERTANTAVGSLASIFCLLPYVPWRNIHFQHHKWVGVVDKDPTQAHLLDLRRMSALETTLFRIVWKLWIPIPFMQFVVRIFWLYPWHEFKVGRHDNARKGAWSVAICLVPHVLAIATLGPGQYLASFGPAIVLFYVMYEIVNLPQHSGLFPFTSSLHPGPIPVHEQDELTRTTYLPRWLAVPLVYNFNFHIEHHLFPSVPWYSLPKVTPLLERSREFRYQRVAFLRFMVHLRSKDPMDVYVNSLPAAEHD
jgi:acyl-lipid omega-6 desaturase (Delta-12 desaturase)